MLGRRRLWLICVALAVGVLDCLPVVQPPTYVYTTTIITNLNEAATDGVKTIPIYLDNEFTESERLDIDEAVKQWNYVLNGQLKLDVVDYHFIMQISTIKSIETHNNGIVIFSVDATSHILNQPEMPGTVLVGQAIIGGHYIYLVVDRMHDDLMLEDIAMHEIGHALGAKHITDRAALMNPEFSLSAYRCIDEASADEVADYQNINRQLINYCTY